jgi:hypothetical protein
MSSTKTGFHSQFCLSLTGLFALIFMAACQPLIQAQTGTQPKIPVSTSHQDVATTPAEQDQPTAPTSTALTAEDIAATPLGTDASMGVQRAIEITRSSQLEKPAVNPTFNPADLVGRSHSYVSAEFGQPDFNRTEGVIHVLQYRQPDCVIDLFINIAGITDAATSADAKILDWAMRERTIGQPLNKTLCQQQFYKRK